MQPCEPVPSPRGPGRIILLNGASSSGKSTLAKALQEVLDEPFLHVSSDQLVAAGFLPQRREEEGPFEWWRQMRPRFFAGFHRCLPALAEAGNDLIQTFGPYDLEVDTTTGAVGEIAESILSAWRLRAPDRALAR